MSEEKYTIGQFSDKVGLSIDTLRFYEHEKLIFPARTAANQRYYTHKDIVWIQFIIRLKKTGMKIKDMQQYAKLRYAGNKTIPQRLDLLFNQLDELHQLQNQVAQNIDFLEKKIKTYQAMQAK
ncbi:MerR family transcriptional regulator [Leuconostocaceae bacterium ESL0723]|nr:MerR family transcriptional regulator [Leuconostocaceae bacterium ESL0723]